MGTRTYRCRKRRRGARMSSTREFSAVGRRFELDLGVAVDTQSRELRVEGQFRHGRMRWTEPTLVLSRRRESCCVRMQRVLTLRNAASKTTRASRTKSGFHPGSDGHAGNLSRAEARRARSRLGKGVAKTQLQRAQDWQKRKTKFEMYPYTLPYLSTST